MSNQSNTSTGGVGLFSLLTVAFVGLKLCGVISWSWWCVLCLLWAPLTIALLVVIVVGIAAIFLSR